MQQKKDFLFAGLLLAFSALACSCGNQPGQHGEKLSDSARFALAAEPAPEWTKLFYRNSGWFGGDGIFAINRSGVENSTTEGDETLIWFSDTMFGDIIKDSLLPGYGMINNSMAILNGGKPDSGRIKFEWKSTGGAPPSSIFIPETPNSKPGDYYWLGDGFVNQEKGNDIYIFGYRINNIPGVAVFGFKEVGNTLIILPAGSEPPFKEQRQVDIPFFLQKDVDSTGSFGAGLLVNTKQAGAPNPDGYLYVYGVRGKKKEVMVARVKPADIETFSLWSFWDGKGWSSNVASIEPVADRASNELSVTPMPDGRYAMVFQLDGLGKYVGLRLGASPSGPFGPPIKIYDVSRDLAESKNLFPYNAKAHPVLSGDKELLISYNINSFDFESDIKLHPHLYRPRFIRLKYNAE